MKRQSMNRWQAFSIHLCISSVIFVTLLFIIVAFWYPGVFIYLGGWLGIKIVAAVDMVLGPLLTLIIFNPAKKTLKIDLTIIAALQISCLAYGIWTIEQQRPLVQALLDDRLYVIPKAQYKTVDIKLDFLNKIPGLSPKMVMLNLPDNHSIIAMEVVNGFYVGNPVHLQTQKYIPITNVVDNNTYQEKLMWRLSRLDFDRERNCYWLPAESSYYKGELCFSPELGAIAQRSF